MPKKVTMTSVANALGISRSLVSYALRNKYGVSEEMKKKIVEKAIEMGYFKIKHPTIKISQKILIVIGEEYLGKESYFMRIISGIEYYALSKNYQPQIVEMKNDESIDDLMSKLIDAKPQGAIVIRQLEPKLASGLKKLNFPFVFIDLIAPTSECYEVRVNNFGNVYELVKKLISEGHKKFCFAGDIAWALSFRERYNGFLYACRENGVKYSEIIGKHTYNEPLDEIGFAKYVRKNNGSVIVCASDSIAVKVYEIISNEGKRIPENFSVVGFDDAYFAKTMNPPLTTMHVPRYDMGKVAFGLLHEQIENVKERSRIICLNAFFVERNSVCPQKNV